MMGAFLIASPLAIVACGSTFAFTTHAGGSK
jgi:hypothetical protein